MLTNTEMFEVAKTLKVNDVIEFREIMNRPKYDRVESARVTAVTVDADKEQVNITYVPCARENSIQCGFGCTFIAPGPNPVHSAGKWGWQWIRKVGEEQPRRIPAMPSLYKNPGYDLVNM